MTDQNKWNDLTAVTASDPTVRQRLASAISDVFTALEMANELRGAVHGEAPVTAREIEPAEGLEGQIIVLGILAGDLRNELARIRV